jgi:hypothetical protein
MQFPITRKIAFVAGMVLTHWGSEAPEPEPVEEYDYYANTRVYV